MPYESEFKGREGLQRGWRAVEGWHVQMAMRETIGHRGTRKSITTHSLPHAPQVHIYPLFPRSVHLLMVIR